MVAQIPLQLVQPIRYSSHAYLVHSGVRALIDSLETLSYQRVFSLAYVQGGEKSGKTHTGVYVVGHSKDRKRPARLIAGDDLDGVIAGNFRAAPLKTGETVVVDDGDLLLKRISESHRSGLFTDLTERLMQVDGTLILFGAAAPELIECTPQIRSRLNAGIHLTLSGPTEEELGQLLDLVTKQRGIRLSESKRSYILKRVARTVPGLVECVERIEDWREPVADSTSFQVLAGALSPE